MRLTTRITRRPISKLSWQLQGADLPQQGIQGQGKLQVQWQEENKQLAFNQIALTANDSTLSGQARVSLSDKPDWSVDLRFGLLNLDNLLVQRDAVAATSGEVQQGKASQRSCDR